MRSLSFSVMGISRDEVVVMMMMVEEERLGGVYGVVVVGFSLLFDSHCFFFVCLVEGRL